MTNGFGKTLLVHRNGQSMVEFALILPLMILLLAGIFDLGRAFFASITITNAAREGARYGSLHRGNDAGDFQNICQATLNEARSSGVSLTPGNVTISCNSGSVTCQASGTPDLVCPEKLPITVNVNYNYDQMVLQFFFPSGINMNRQVEMLVQ